ncbi:MAG TPA: N-acetylmuramoyl-L-alanine amidase [Holophaga sp.]|nr:N-acetylmuramoyl-L-alanine amidase [Holophaga sp.]HPS66349.1 N-acetylmuramoyl-L-alanine amidase [Holophaga sp.]
MGKRIGAFLALALVPAALMAQANPAPAQVSAEAPNGARVRLRLVFKKGVQVEGTRLPDRFVKPGTPEGWIAYENLSPEAKRWVLQSMFPEDVWGREGVKHHVRWPELESVWLMASLFTGHGQNYDQLQRANPQMPEKLRKGDAWTIPRALLSVDLGGNVRGVVDRSQPEDDLDDADRIQAYRALLAYDEDAEGKFAYYHLRKGEALYSSVVMRYSDRVDPKDVNDLALTIAKRSGIEDLRTIQPGQIVKIPVEYLADPFQPEGSQALAEDREVREEVRRTRRIEAGPKLAGVRIVLDAGHGGVDVGAMANSVWESDYVYDVAMRVRRILEQDTEAVVSSTIRYPGCGFKVRDNLARPTRSAEILTTPPFANDGESPNAVSVHLRWVLANDLFASFSRRGDVQKTLFISFHADALHPSAHGTMVYVPGAAAVPASFALSPSRGAGVAEMKRGGRVSFTEKERIQAEARSRLFAEGLLKTLRDEQLPVHSNRPIRNIIRREGKNYLPAVIRYNTAATKVLVEIVNLTNEEDAASIKDPAFRERYAEAVVKGIRAYYRTS